MSRFDVNPRLEQVVPRQAEVAVVLAAAATKVEAEARRIATPISHRFEEGIDSTAGVDVLGPFGRVNANWWGSLFVELGTKDQPPRPILRRALDSLRRS